MEFRSYLNLSVYRVTMLLFTMVRLHNKNEYTRMCKSNGTLEIHHDIQVSQYESTSPLTRTQKCNYFGNVGMRLAPFRIRSFVNVEGAVFSIFMHHSATENIQKRCACKTLLHPQQDHKMDSLSLGNEMRGGPCPKKTTQNSHYQHLETL